jgi:LPS sulfotransferase NodH
VRKFPLNAPSIIRKKKRYEYKSGSRLLGKSVARTGQECRGSPFFEIYAKAFWEMPLLPDLGLNETPPGMHLRHLVGAGECGYTRQTQAERIRPGPSEWVERFALDRIPRVRLGDNK